MELISDYEYTLPQRLIASAPPEERTSAKLMVIRRDTGLFEHHGITQLPGLLQPGDCLVINNTRVIPAKLQGYRTSTEGKWEGLYLGQAEGGAWRVIGQTRGKIQPGETISITPAGKEGEEANPDIPLLELELIERNSEEGSWTMRPRSETPFLELLDVYGAMPLPPYIKREGEKPFDRERYQTTYAEEPGSVAAPTAGLHFTPELLDQCRQRGIEVTSVTLHVGLGTFRPMKVERLEDHQMHAEWCEVPAETVEVIQRTKASGGKIVAVGTTTVRTLESASQEGELKPWIGETDLFIRPPYEFRTVDQLLTNFHLPKSTLLVLVSALAGNKLISQAYKVAINKEYRFFSYGDAMLIL
ncbi:S-adenosylmethionine:tRNA ribosyltransferase-isomerase [Polystyrenella longa]|uniref:S-adenosylmethionine:tRNA ribosyltransferase-isomerase n=1 Tax=Polystyrenella longa TaxID=2528007 RepID=A0A518CNP6_9PLAN|nr:tRNA preQ1(34) S-adenosylmethionine ribosyltransferase-isomerase QueA [Polystyrenella longa]QDU80850.1 S-adenosylmethionine:tRNA ribosyltransferase-isomerase [Polystyrenella longa]